jgi:hypothetical protein
MSIFDPKMEITASGTGGWIGWIIADTCTRTRDILRATMSIAARIANLCGFLGSYPRTLTWTAVDLKGRYHEKHTAKMPLDAHEEHNRDESECTKADGRVQVAGRAFALVRFVEAEVASKELHNSRDCGTCSASPSKRHQDQDTHFAKRMTPRM